ncbi:MAG: hypothetical protein UZ18_ATM001000333 [Armatimonadetes bacterium OLB18]|nr:MAG: hypothetical protein UZ18_ATM001000333 [Armatimonadetes bacterium OLB18]
MALEALADIRYYVSPPSIPDLWRLQVVLALFVTSYGCCIGVAVLRLRDSWSARLFLAMTTLLYALPSAMLLSVASNPEEFADAPFLVWWGSLVFSMILGPLAWWISERVRSMVSDMEAQRTVLWGLLWTAWFLWTASIVAYQAEKVQISVDGFGYAEIRASLAL